MIPENAIKNPSVALLSISIPTYNRAARLQRSLIEIQQLIIKEGFENIVSVFVSDNGSTDETLKVLKREKINFHRNNIVLKYESNYNNMGFDYNVRQCFIAGNEKYCWFVSDDDNLDGDILKNIIKYIDYYNPNLIFFNFNQTPYGKDTPLILQDQYSNVRGSDFGFSQFIKFPKLTSLVIKRKNIKVQTKILNYEEVKSCAFTHIALALQTAFDFGGVLLSKEFSGTPDRNYRDHIDFPPYVGNKANKMIATVFEKMGHPEWTQLHAGEHVDVAISSLEWLTDYYKGRAVVSDELRAILKNDLKNEIVNKKLTLIFRPKFVRRCIYLLNAYMINYLSFKFLNKLKIKKLTSWN